MHTNTVVYSLCMYVNQSPAKM